MQTHDKIFKYSIYAIVVLVTASILGVLALSPVDKTTAVDIDTEITPVTNPTISQVTEADVLFTDVVQYSCKANGGRFRTVSFVTDPINKNSTAWVVEKLNNARLLKNELGVAIQLPGTKNPANASLAGVSSAYKFTEGYFEVSADINNFRFWADEQSAPAGETIVSRLAVSDQALFVADFLDERAVNKALDTSRGAIRLYLSRDGKKLDYILRIHVTTKEVSSTPGADANSVIVDLIKVTQKGNARLVASQDVSRNTNLAMLVNDLSKLAARIELKLFDGKLSPTVLFRDRSIEDKPQKNTVWYKVELAPEGVDYNLPNGLAKWGLSARNMTDNVFQLTNTTLKGRGCV